MKKILFFVFCCITLNTTAQTTCNYGLIATPNGEAGIIAYTYAFDSLDIATPTYWTLSNGTTDTTDSNFIEFFQDISGWYEVCAMPQGCAKICDSVFVPVPTASFIIQSVSPAEMVQDFFQGSCVTVSNVSFSGDMEAASYFQGAFTPLGINAGILLTSGKASDAPLPNSSSGTTTDVNGVDSDAQMDALANNIPTYDAAFLEFDFVSTEDSIKFKYIFASEEYPEFACSSFNDVFAFFISGGDFSSPVNIATVPNTNNTIPISINTINGDEASYCGFFYNNPIFPQYYITNNGDYITYDGMTTPLWAMVQVTPGMTYHARIAIADVADAIFDSGVFIGSESLCGSEMVTPMAEVNTAINNGNVVHFVNKSRYGTDYFWDFGDGTTSTEVSPTHAYATNLSSTGYDVSLRINNYCCETIFNMRVGVPAITDLHTLAETSQRVQPNPATDFLQLNLKNNQPAKITLFDLTGRVIFTKTIGGSERLDLTGIATGMLMVQIEQNGVIYRDKLLHQ